MSDQPDYGEPWSKSSHGPTWIDNKRCMSIGEMIPTYHTPGVLVERIIACVNFCQNVPSYRLKPRGLLDSFRPLADGSVTDCLTMEATIGELREQLARARLDRDVWKTNAERFAEELENQREALKEAREAIKLLKLSVATKELVLDEMRKQFAERVAT
jgi:hypothetical protein